MKHKLTKEEAQAFRARWDRVNARQRAELRRMTPDEKLDELGRLMEWVRVFGWAEQLASEDEEVRERWRRLREHYLGPSA